MTDTWEVGKIIFTGLVILFILGIVGYVMFILLGVYVAPMFKYMLAGSGYEGSVDMAWNMFKILFILIIITVFGYIIVKLFFEREPTTHGYYGGY